MWWFLFRRYFLSQRSGSIIRTLSWISVGAVSIGVAALILVLSVMNGFNESIQRKLLSAEPHVITFTNSAFNERPDYLKDEEVKSFHPFEQQDVILKTNDGLFAGAIARGVDEEHLSDYLKGLKSQRSIGKSQSELFGQSIKSGEIVVGIDLARSLGIYEGDRLIVIPPDYLLMPPSEIPNMDRVGVHALFSSDVPEIDARMLFYVKDKTLQSFKRSASLESGWEIKLKNASRADQWAKKMNLPPETYTTWQERNSALFFALKMEKAIMSFFLSICILITSFSIISVLILFITQKKTEIGVLMALGFSRNSIKQMLMRFGVFLSSLGLGGGLVIGLTITLILQHHPIKLLPTDVYYDSSLPARLDWMQVGFVAMGCVLLGVFCSFVSSHRRELLSPADAFRSGK